MCNTSAVVVFNSIWFTDIYILLYLRMYQHGSLLFNIPQMYVMDAEGQGCRLCVGMSFSCCVMLFWVPVFH